MSVTNMLFKLSTIAALAFTASALTLNTPTNWQADTSVTLTWTSVSSDPVFTLELITTSSDLALVSNVQPAPDFLNFELPLVPAGSGYRVQAVNVSDNEEIYAQSGPFSIAAAPSS